MAKKTENGKSVPGRLAKVALGLPEVEAGPSCNKTAYKAGKKNFLFVGEKDGGFNVMLKVVESLGEVEKVAKASGGRLPVGSNGWVSAEYENGDDVPVGEMEGWVV